MATSKLRYPSLVSSETAIRVLELQPGSQTDPLVSKLYVIDLKDRPEYAALSYVWGDGKDTIPLTCNGQVLQVTKNLSDALRSMRIGNAPLTIWVDFVCINQADVPERNSQVKLMAQIYRSAKEVLIWLGQDSNDISETVFNEVEELIQDIVDLSDDNMDLEDMAWDYMQELYSDAPLIQIFKSAWFTRTWVFQEAGLATKAVVHWGATSIDWNKIGLTSMFLMRHCKQTLAQCDALNDINRAFQLYTMFLPINQVRRLTHALDDARSHQATDSRDKVYAFLAHPGANASAGDYMPRQVDSDDSGEDGFDQWRNLALVLAPSQAILDTARLDHIEPGPLRPLSPDTYSTKRILNEKAPKRPVARYRPGPSFIIPDYHKSVVDVYQDLALKMIERNNSLEILSAVQHDDQIPEIGPQFPSWVPRWDTYVGMKMLGKVTCDHFAAGNNPPIITPTQDKSVLKVKAIIFDTVAIRSSRPMQRDQFDPLNMKSPVWSMYQISGVADPANPPYPRLPVFPNISTSNRIAAYRDTFTAGRSNTDSALDGYDRTADFADYQLKWSAEVLKNEEWEEATAISMMQLKREAAGGSAERYAKTAAEVSHQRRFFITRTGFYGLGPGITQLGDIVCILFGADVPFLVRKRRDHYILVGECFVHGIMTGQAVRAWRAGICDAVDLEIH